MADALCLFPPLLFRLCLQLLHIRGMHHPNAAADILQILHQVTGLPALCPDVQLDKKKGNVFYDLKIRQQRADLDGTLFEGQVDTRIIRGRKLFSHPVSMDICRACAKLCRDEIEWKVRMEYSRELFHAEYYGKEFSIEVLDIRVMLQLTVSLFIGAAHCRHIVFKCPFDAHVPQAAVALPPLTEDKAAEG